MSPTLLSHLYSKKKILSLMSSSSVRLQNPPKGMLLSVVKLSGLAPPDMSGVLRFCDYYFCFAAAGAVVAWSWPSSA